MPIAGTLGGSITTYVETFIPSPPPISENVLDFLDTFIPGGPPIREGAMGDFVGGILDEFQPSGPPILEGFTDGLHFIIDAFKPDTGPGLGDGFIVF